MDGAAARIVSRASAAGKSLALWSQAGFVSAWGRIRLHEVCYPLSSAFIKKGDVW